MAAALRLGYPENFQRNEFAYKLDKSKLTDLVVELTGLERENQVVRNIVGTFSALNAYADFDGEDVDKQRAESLARQSQAEDYSTRVLPASSVQSNAQPVGMNLSYTINLNLPPSPDVEVFNAIFRALKENTLK